MKTITRERESRGWSRAELSRRAGLNAATVGQIEAGRLVPYSVQLDKIAEALEYAGEPDTLLEEVGSDGATA